MEAFFIGLLVLSAIAIGAFAVFVVYKLFSGQN